jgi:hypothetical protein
MEDEQRENAPLPGSAKCEDALALEYLEWTENAEIERARQKANVPRRGCQSTDRALKALSERAFRRSVRPAIERRSR